MGKLIEILIASLLCSQPGSDEKKLVALICYILCDLRGHKGFANQFGMVFAELNVARIDPWTSVYSHSERVRRQSQLSSTLVLFWLLWRGRKLSSKEKPVYSMTQDQYDTHTHTKMVAFKCESTAIFRQCDIDIGTYSQ